MLQESLRTVLRHAGPAAKATVRLSFEPTALGITVSDDGIGSNGDHEGQGTVTEERGLDPAGGSGGSLPRADTGQGTVTEERGLDPAGGSGGSLPRADTGQGTVTEERGLDPAGGSGGSIPPPHPCHA